MGVESPVVGRAITRGRRSVRGDGLPGRATDLSFAKFMLRVSITRKKVHT